MGSAVSREPGSPAPSGGRARRPGPPLSLWPPWPKPPPHRPRGLKNVRCEAGAVEADRVRSSPCCPLPGIGAVRTGSERRIRGLWSVDANRLRRARAEDRGREGAADRSRKWPLRLRCTSARQSAHARSLGARGRGPERVRRGRVWRQS